jgi:hypothetical protein
VRAAAHAPARAEAPVTLAEILFVSSALDSADHWPKMSALIIMFYHEASYEIHVTRRQRRVAVIAHVAF